MGIFGVESFFFGGGALEEELHGSFSDIGAHQDFQMPEFFMPITITKRTMLYTIYVEPHFFFSSSDHSRFKSNVFKGYTTSSYISQYQIIKV